jgi:hypothetical protein
VEISEDKILDTIKQRGRAEQVDQANQELPDNVDPERDSGKLERIGINRRPAASPRPRGGPPHFRELPGVRRGASP